MIAKLKTVASFADERLREPSTWASLGLALGYFGLSVDPTLWGHLSTAGVALACAAGVLLSEKK